MLDEYMKIGDEVTVTIPEENRYWGYNPCPDGTKATILGFSEIAYGRTRSFGLRPGIYVNRSWVKIRLESGQEYTEWSGRLDLVDKAEYARREAEFHKWQKESGECHHNEFLRELPITPFWEWDIVRVCGMGVLMGYAGNVFIVTGINYSYLNDKRIDGSKYPAYSISESVSAGWSTAVSEDNMALIERGKIWKFYHNEPIVFDGLEDEIRFSMALGQYKEVRNPACNLYKWTKDEVLSAIRCGIAHGFSLASGFFGAAPSVMAVRFHSEDLGRRVAQATLEGFDLPLLQSIS